MLLNKSLNNIKVSRRFSLMVLLGAGIKVSVGKLIKIEETTQTRSSKNPTNKKSNGFGSGNYGSDPYGI